MPCFSSGVSQGLPSSDSSLPAGLLECPNFIQIANVYGESVGTSMTRTLALPLDSFTSSQVPDSPKLQCHFHRPVTFEEGQESKVQHSQH